MTEYEPVEKTAKPDWGDGPDTVEIPTDAIEVDVEYEHAADDAVAEPPLRVIVRYLRPVGGDGSE